MMRPPFEEGVCFDLIGVVGEDTATLGKNLIEFLQSLEVFIDDRLVRQRPQAFGGLDLWRVRWQEHQFNAFRNHQILGDMPARAVEHQDDVLVGPASAANDARSALNRAVLTPSAMNHTTSPVAGRTKPYR